MNKNHNYRLLTLDMDGTLLNSRQKIPKETVAAINELLERGIQVSLATGRGMAEIIDFKEDLRQLRYGILSSGSLVYDFQKAESIFFQPLSPEDVLKLMEMGKAEDAMVHLLTLHGSIAREQDIDRMEEFHMGPWKGLFKEICRPTGDLAAYAKTHWKEITKLNLYHRSEESRQRNAVSAKPLGLATTFTDTMGIEFSPAGITKASGLRVLCKHLDIPLEDVVSIGDGSNDREILQTAGLSVAMGNARDEIKALCDATVADNDHNGVLEAIRTYF